MKTLYQIFVALFLLILLFIVRDDVRIEYNNLLTYFGSKTDVSTLSSKNIDEQVSSVSNEIKNTATQTVNTPGALALIDRFVNSTTSNKDELSIANVIKETNLNRKENGNLIALKENSKLDFSAEKKLQDMFAKQYFEHVSPSGVGITDLAKQIGYDYILIGENLALGNFGGDKALVDAWMTSPGHRANILNNRYTEIGVAVGHGTYQGRSVWLAVQHFGLPQSACPSISQALYGVIQINQTDLKSMSSNLATLRTEVNKGGVYSGMTTNELIDKYNTSVKIYNQLISDTKEKISKYNQEVKDFNTCITNNT